MVALLCSFVKGEKKEVEFEENKKIGFAKGKSRMNDDENGKDFSVGGEKKHFKTLSIIKDKLFTL